MEDTSVLEIVPFKDAPTSIPLRRYLNCLDQDDPKLIQAMTSHYIRQIVFNLFNIYNWLNINYYRALDGEKSYNEDTNFDRIRKNEKVSEYWQDEILDTLLFQGKIKNGFFIEAGAWDFTTSSNSLWYELKHNWTGLLIEPVPEMCYKGYITLLKVTWQKVKWSSSVKM